MTIGAQTSDHQTITLWRPVGPEELVLIEQSGMRAFPPRLPEQPIFYPVLSEDDAVKIARDWNVPASGAGFVTRFEVLARFLAQYPCKRRADPLISNTGSRPATCWISMTPLSDQSRSSTRFVDCLREKSQIDRGGVNVGVRKLPLSGCAPLMSLCRSPQRPISVRDEGGRAAVLPLLTLPD